MKKIRNPLENFLNKTSSQKMAVALSGGADSLALAHMALQLCIAHKIELHILHVDHGLRLESAKEAKMIEKNLKPNFEKNKNIYFKILTWRHKKIPSNKIQEQAREARYKLMAAYCKKFNIEYLLTAHHADDQAETILFRLARGSFIDGLSGIDYERSYNNNLTLIRPLLNLTHQNLVDYCKRHQLSWLEDPSNENKKFARVRLRQSMNILEQEGLNAARLLKFSARCRRAADALEVMTIKIWQDAVIEHSRANKNISFELEKVKNAPLEIKIRLIQKALSAVSAAKKYPPSLERIEEIAEALDIKTNGRYTLTGSLIEWSKTKKQLRFTKEKIKN